MNIIDDLLSKGTLRNDNGAILTLESPEYITWMKSDIHEEILSDINILEQVLKLMKELDADNPLEFGWNKETDTEDKKTWYRTSPDFNSVDLAYECIVKDYIFKPLSLFAEVDLYANWMPKVKQCKLLKNHTRFRKTLYCEMNLPWPFHNRDGIIHGYGTTLPDQKAVILVIRTLR